MNAVAIWALSLAGGGLSLGVTLLVLIAQHAVYAHADRAAEDIARTIQEKQHR